MKVASLVLVTLGSVVTIAALVRLAQLRPKLPKDVYVKTDELAWAAVTGRAAEKLFGEAPAFQELSHYVVKQSTWSLVAAVGATVSLVGAWLGWLA